MTVKVNTKKNSYEYIPCSKDDKNDKNDKDYKDYKESKKVYQQNRE